MELPRLNVMELPIMVFNTTNHIGLTNIAAMAKVTLMPSSKILLGLINYDSIGVSLVTCVLSK